MYQLRITSPLWEEERIEDYDNLTDVYFYKGIYEMNDCKVTVRVKE